MLGLTKEVMRVAREKGMIKESRAKQNKKKKDRVVKRTPATETAKVTIRVVMATLRNPKKRHRPHKMKALHLTIPRLLMLETSPQTRIHQLQLRPNRQFRHRTL